ncbi:MAG: hypothetical protein GY749_09855, partial [Desulfobacteraceae bacterium]|nr:hypothetical protein [Desulfobacteraceae bacterium]
CFEDFGTWKVYHPDAWLEEVEKDDSDVRVTTYDMNGDGLTDIIWGDNDNDRWRVCINTGSNFLSPADWTPPGMNDEDIIDIEDHDNKEKANDTKRNLADINGDGLPDVVHARDDGKNWDVYFNKGNGFTGSKDWYSHFDTKYVRDITYDDEDESKVRRDMFDITGDGLPDIVQRTDQGHWNVYANHYTKADLLVKITDTLGGIAETDYTASANFSNTRLPFNYWLVASVTTNNNMAGPHSNISSRNFSYNGGLYDFSTREFRGFATVTETLPNTSEIIHYYHQDEGKKGKEIKSEVKSASGKPYSAMETIWNASETNGVYTTLLNRKDEHTFDGTPVNPKIVRTEYKNYDKYGNIGLEIYHGDIGTSADNLYAYNEYWPSCGGDNQISDRLKKQYVKASSGGPRLRESFFWYDHLTNCVYKGNLTREEAWLDIGENPVTTHEYDDYGNRIQTVDPEKRMAKTEYDPVYHTFPEKIYNAK